MPLHVHDSACEPSLGLVLYHPDADAQAKVISRKKFDSSPAIFQNCWMLCDWGNGVADGSAVRCRVDGVPDHDVGE